MIEFTPTTKVREISQQQLDAGYIVFANGATMRCSYTVILKTAVGTYIVVEPEFKGPSL